MTIDFVLVGAMAAGAIVGLAIYPWRHKTGLASKERDDSGPFLWVCLFAFFWPYLLLHGIFFIARWWWRKFSASVPDDAPID